MENDADNSAVGNGSSGVCTNKRPRSGLGFDVAGMVVSLSDLSKPGDGDLLRGFPLALSSMAVHAIS